MYTYIYIHLHSMSVYIHTHIECVCSDIRYILSRNEAGFKGLAHTGPCPRVPSIYNLRELSECNQ